MQFGNRGLNIAPERRNNFILAIIIAILVIILLGVLYFIKQRDLGEEVPGSISSPKMETHNIKELIQLTSAPEKNPDIKPNPTLTAMTSAPENNLEAKADPNITMNLTAPRN